MQKTNSNYTLPIISEWSEAWRVLGDLSGITVSPFQQAKLTRFYAQLILANERMNLTKLTSLSDFLTFHLLDTGLIWHSLIGRPIPKNYLDLGSGCGVPGLIMHILEGESMMHTLLCESRKLRSTYLSSVVSGLDLRNILVQANKAESILKNPMRFDLITARAFAKPPVTLAIACPLLKREGLFVAQTSESVRLSPEYTELLRKLRAEVIEEKQWELGGKTRFITIIRKL